MNYECSICYENIPITEISSLPNCDHKYHAKCIFQWINTKISEGKVSCPYCRNTIIEASSERSLPRYERNNLSEQMFNASLPDDYVRNISILSDDWVPSVLPGFSLYSRTISMPNAVVTNNNTERSITYDIDDNGRGRVRRPWEGTYSQAPHLMTSNELTSSPLSLFPLAYHN